MVQNNSLQLETDAVETVAAKRDLKARQWRAFVYSLLIVASSGFFAWLARAPLAEFMRFIADREEFSVYIRQFGLLGPIVLSGLQMAQVIVAIFPGYPFFLAAGYIYGLLPGFALNLLSVVAASQMGFAIARWFGRPVVNRLAPSEVVDRWDGAARRYGFPFFLSAFLLPIFPADTMNYVAGLSPISGHKFLLASVLGRAPSIFFLTFLGSRALEIVAMSLPWWQWVLLALGCIGLYAGWQFVFEKIKPKSLKL